MGLYAGARADGNAPLDFDEWADEYAVSEGAAVEIDRLNEGHAFAKFDVDDAAVVNLGLAHDSSKGALVYNNAHAAAHAGCAHGRGADGD